MSPRERTRLSLHAVAELLLAGPQFAESRTIKLKPVPGGFATVAPPAVAVVGTDLVFGERSVRLAGRTVAEVAADAGITARSLTDLYAGGCGLEVDHLLEVDPGCAAEIFGALAVGAEALALLAPDAERVLWPEHFDIGISLDKVNYGISPGDGFLAAPYAYVGPWELEHLAGGFWNAPFGAARAMGDFADAQALADFFEEGRREHEQPR